MSIDVETEQIKSLGPHISIVDLQSLIMAYAKDDQLDLYERIHSDVSAILEIAAKIGRVDTFRKFRINKLSIENKRSLIKKVAQYGHVPILIELRIGWRLTREDACVYDNLAMRMAAGNGVNRASNQLGIETRRCSCTK